MLPVRKRTGAKRLVRALACRAGGDVAPVELPPHVARAGHGELELRQAGGVHVRARDGPGRLQRRREDALSARNRRREESDRSNRCQRDDAAPADRRRRGTRTPGPSFHPLLRDNRLLLMRSRTPPPARPGAHEREARARLRARRRSIAPRIARLRSRRDVLRSAPISRRRTDLRRSLRSPQRRARSPLRRASWASAARHSQPSTAEPAANALDPCAGE